MVPPPDAGPRLAFGRGGVNRRGAWDGWGGRLRGGAKRFIVQVGVDRGEDEERQRMAEQVYHGACHCGAVRFSAALNLDDGTVRCNCSLCSKSRAWLAFTPADKFHLERGADALTTYRWTPPGKPEPNLTYHSCAVCGVRTHAEGKGPGGAATVAVQVACLENADPDLLATHIHYLDGRHDRFDKPPADTRLL
jgi:hypothetical protein